MKAEELMIGDWVMQAQFTDDNGNGHGWKYIKVVEIPFDEDKYIEPIQLTKEILVKNDIRWLSSEPSGRTTYCCNEPWINCTYIPNNGWVICVGPAGSIKVPYSEASMIQYVHQLQHLLRLAGYEKEIIV